MELLTPYLIERRFHIIAGFLSLLVVDLLQLFIPRIIKWAIDSITAAEDIVGAVAGSQLLKYAFLIFLSSIMIGIFRFFWRVLIMGSARRVEEGIRGSLFNHIQTLPATFFNKHTAGDLMAHATNDMTNIRMALSMGIVGLTDAVVLGIAAVFFMSYINLELTVMALLPMPFIALSTKILSKKLFNAYRDVQASFSDLMESTRERFAGIKVIMAFNRENIEAEAMKNESEIYVKKNMELVRLRGLIFPMVIFLTNVSLAIILGAGGRKVILNQISPGDFVAFISYLGLLTWPVMAIGWVTNLIQRGKASIDRINDILAVPSESVSETSVTDDFLNTQAQDSTVVQEASDLIITDAEVASSKLLIKDTEAASSKLLIKDAEAASSKLLITDAEVASSKLLIKDPETAASKLLESDFSIHGDVEFRDLFFSYDSSESFKDSSLKKGSGIDSSNISQKKLLSSKELLSPNVLSGISFRLNRGEMLGIAGPPGSGKSTLASLIPRIYDPQKGTITIDGVNIGHIPLETLRKNISFMPQEPFLFSGTIHANLLFGNPEADDSDIAEAIEMAQLTETIADFPMGIETIIGEKGVMLSGGQRQRIALARAFLKSAPIMIMDDPVSQVDMQTASRIINIIESFAGQKTMIIISHRFSIFKNANHIMVLNEGKITEQGTHHSLIEEGGYYAGAWHMQESE
ncbi:membrane hypothetical protein [Desulfamplus magnetovallimortis]|uniref:Multidrug resistance-like ATP-binding protein MdlA n=2 Tax=Desulfamplus magnetovallimortis TaxID=1246637 RepID=A0A1W1H8D5_9BACT|nr:membrane hypothetical protein [Desulfamplus magnetovallimortis]